MVVHTCHPRTWEVETGEQEFKASLGYKGNSRLDWATCDPVSRNTYVKDKKKRKEKEKERKKRKEKEKPSGKTSGVGDVNFKTGDVA